MHFAFRMVKVESDAGGLRVAAAGAPVHLLFVLRSPLLSSVLSTLPARTVC